MRTRERGRERENEKERESEGKNDFLGASRSRHAKFKKLTGQDDGVLAEQGDAASVGGPDGVPRA